jgi:hypothetical protein
MHAFEDMNRQLRDKYNTLAHTSDDSVSSTLLHITLEYLTEEAKQTFTVGYLSELAFATTADALRTGGCAAKYAICMGYASMWATTDFIRSLFD